MDAFNGLLASFEKIATHLRHEFVLVGFVFLLVVASAWASFMPWPIFFFGFVISICVFYLSYLKLRRLDRPQLAGRNNEVDIGIARKLAELADFYENEQPAISQRLRAEARRRLMFADRPDLASDIQDQMDRQRLPPDEP